jgi:hypothetical protein
MKKTGFKGPRSLGVEGKRYKVIDRYLLFLTELFRRPQTADRRPQTADRRPQTADRRPQTADRRPQTTI